jgi:hypothetical protein
MTIEANLQSIAESLAVIANHIVNKETIEQAAKLPEAVVTIEEPTPEPEVVEPTPEPTVAEVTVTEVVEPTPEPTVTIEELNKTLVNEVERLGGREKIDQLLREKFEVQGLRDLDVAKYGELAKAVKELS